MHNQYPLHPLPLCRQFRPLGEWLESQPIAVVSAPSPQEYTPTPEITGHMRDYRQVGRQVGYLRKVVKTEVGQQVQDMLGEEQASIEKLGNNCVIANNSLYYAHRTHIYTLPTSVSNLMQSEIQNKKEVWRVAGVPPQKLIDIHHNIHELKSHKEHLLARTPRSIEAIHPHCKHTRTLISTPNEIVHYTISSQSDHIVTTLNHPHSVITAHPNTRPQHASTLCRVDGLVNSVVPLTRHDYLITTRKHILLHDSRQQHTNFVKSQLEDTIYSAISIESSLVVTCQSQHFALFDIRKPQLPAYLIPHHCSEAPPHIMQTLPSSRDQDPFNSSPSPDLLLSHSPYYLGSTLLTTLNPTPLTHPHDHFMQCYSQHYSSDNQPQLLYDTGKIKMGYHPRSVAIHPLSNNNFAFIHIDNHQGIAVEVMKPQENIIEPSPHKNANNYEFMQRLPVVKAFGLDCIKDANLEWHAQHTLKKQLEPEKDYWDEVWQQEQGIEWDEPNPIEKRTVNYANLTSFFRQIHSQGSEQEEQQSRPNQMATLQATIPTQSLQRQQPPQRKEPPNIDLSQEDLAAIVDEWQLW